VRRFLKNGGAVAGIIWYQGESETMAPNDPAAYPGKMKQLVKAFRRDLRNPRLPIAMVQIARIVGWAEFPNWNVVQEMQRNLPCGINDLAVVPAIDLPLDDGIHISGRGHQRLGVRLAHAMLNVMQYPASPTPPPIALKSVAVQAVPERNLATLIVSFDNVVGSLQGGPRPSGFVLLDERDINFVFDIQLQRNCAILRTDRAVSDISGKRLYYGYGCDPVCTITDAADRSLPAFGPFQL
jgi:sialate O-acetylesterase